MKGADNSQLLGMLLTCCPSSSPLFFLRIFPCVMVVAARESDRRRRKGARAEAAALEDAEGTGKVPRRRRGSSLQPHEAAADSVDMTSRSISLSPLCGAPRSASCSSFPLHLTQNYLQALCSLHTSQSEVSRQDRRYSHSTHAGP